MNNRTRKRALKIALAGRLLRDPWYGETFGARAAVDVADELLRKAKFPRNVNVRVPMPEDYAEAYRIASDE